MEVKSSVGLSTHLKVMRLNLVTQGIKNTVVWEELMRFKQAAFVDIIKVLTVVIIY